MGKKDKKDNRVQGNLQPAASSRASEMTGLTFASFASPTFSSSGFEDPTIFLYDQLNSEVQVMFKKLSKRDQATRLKALEEILDYVTKIQDENELHPIITVWAKSLQKTLNDTDRRVREAASKLFLKLCQLKRKAFGPHLKEIVPTWIAARSDPSREVSKNSIDAFQECFPNKQKDVLTMCLKSTGEYLHDNLFFQTADTLSDARFVSEEDRISKYNRVIGCSLLALVYLMENLPIAILESEESINAIFVDNRLFSFLNNQASLIGKAASALLRALSVHNPDLVKAKIKIIGKYFMTKQLFNHSVTTDWVDVFDTLAILAKTESSIWTFDNSSWNKYIQLIKTAHVGFLEKTLPYTLTLIAYIPTTIAHDEKQLSLLFDTFLELLANPKFSRSQKDILSLGESYYECLVFVLTQQERFPFEKTPWISKFVSPFSTLLTLNVNEKAIQSITREFIKLAGFKEHSANISKLILRDVFTWIENQENCIDSPFILYLLETLIPPIYDAGDSIRLGLQPEINSLVRSMVEPSSSIESQLSREKLLFLLSLFKSLPTSEVQENDLAKLADLVQFWHIDNCSTQPPNTHSSLLWSFIELNAKHSVDAAREEWNWMVGQFIKEDNKTLDSNTMLLLLGKIRNCSSIVLAEFDWSSDVFQDHFLEKGDTMLFEQDNWDVNEMPVFMSIIELSVSIPNPPVSRKIIDGFMMSVAGCISEWTSTCLNIESTSLLDIPLDTFYKNSFQLISELSANKENDSNSLLWKLLSGSSKRLLVGDLFSLSLLKTPPSTLKSEDTHPLVFSCSISTKIVDNILNHLDKLSMEDREDIVSGFAEKMATRIVYADATYTYSDFMPMITKLQKVSDSFFGRILSLKFWKENFHSFGTQHIVQNRLAHQWELNLCFNCEEGQHLVDSLSTTKSASTQNETLMAAYIRCIDILLECFEDQLQLFEIRLSKRLLMIYELVRFQLFRGFDQDVNRTIEEIFKGLADWSSLEFHRTFILFLQNKIDEGQTERGDCKSHRIIDCIQSWRQEFSETDFMYKAVIFAILRRVSVKIPLLSQLQRMYQDSLMQITKEGQQKMTFMSTIMKIHLVSIRPDQAFLQCLFNEFQNQLLSEASADTSSYIYIPALVCFGIMTVLKNVNKLEMDACIRIRDKMIELLEKWIVEEQVTVWFQVYCASECCVWLLYNNLIDLQEKRVLSIIDNLIQFHVLDSKKRLKRNEYNFTAVLNVLIALTEFLKKPTSLVIKTYQEIILPEFLDKTRLPHGGKNYNIVLLPQELISSVIFTPEEVLFENKENLARQLVDHIRSPYVSPAMAFASFCLLERLVREYVQEQSLVVEMSSSDSEVLNTPTDETGSNEQQKQIRLPQYIVKGIFTQELENKKTTKIMNYLLQWVLILEHLHNATFKLKTGYTKEIRQHEKEWIGLLETIFELLEIGQQGSVLSSMSQHYGHHHSEQQYGRQFFDLSLWDVSVFRPSDIVLEDYLMNHDYVIKLLAAHLFYKCLVTLPSLIRIWWMECKNRQLTLAVEKFVEEYFSPSLITLEFNSLSVADKSTLQGMSTKINKSTNEVVAGYLIEDISLDIMIKLPNNYPLRQINVSGGAHAGVSENRWRGWLLSTASILTVQNGSIVDALSLFKKNLDLHFDGVEDCAICYSVIGLDRSLPSKRCRTCKHLFHGSCLFKWFKSSHQSSCPLCRSIF